MNHTSLIASGRLTRLLLLVLLLLTLGSAQALADTAQSGPTFTVNTTADVVDGVCGVDHCSLREALLAANHNNDTNTIVLPPGNYLLTLTGANEDFAERGDLDISADVTITGSSAAETVIDAGGPGGLSDRVFHVLSGNVQISDVTITGGAPLSGEKEGAGIKHTGHKLTLTRVILAGNVTANNGGRLEWRAASH
jgi:CSLREA domain-containing protein